MAFDKREFDLETIKKNYNISQAWIDAVPFGVEGLEKIYDDFCANLPRLEDKRNEILTHLNKELSDKVHSMRGRVKSPEHLIEKIIRNINCKPDKYGGIDLDNYNKLITDLIGIRIIILDKRQWRAVHDVLLDIFRNEPDRYVQTPKDIETFYDKYQSDFKKKGVTLNDGYHAEKPVVYITSEDDRELYKDEYLKVDTSKSHYRSIHYIIRYENIYFEIQVRTLFEEGWLEFDHLIKYPYDQNNKKKQEYANILSCLAIAADSFISFYEEKDFQTSVADVSEGEEKIIVVQDDDEPKGIDDIMRTRF